MILEDLNPLLAEKLEKIRSLNWVAVKDWSQLTETYIDNKNNILVGKRDIENFVENVFREVARKSGLSYEELGPVLKDENAAFFSAVNCLFSSNGGNGLDSKAYRLVKVKEMLRIPDICNLKSNVEKILTDFSTLTEMEKLEVLQQLHLVKVKVEFVEFLD